MATDAMHTPATTCLGIKKIPLTSANPSDQLLGTAPQTGIESAELAQQLERFGRTVSAAARKGDGPLLPREPSS